MTTEDDFHAALAANPDDWQTMLVFADWLDDRDDPRGPGYRALGRLERAPLAAPVYGTWNRPEKKYVFDRERTLEFPLRPLESYHLPGDWWDAGAWGRYDSRRAAEDAAALAFARLSADRRAELLRIVEVAARAG